MTKAILLVAALVLVTAGLALRGRFDGLKPPALSATRTDPTWTPAGTPRGWRCIVIHQSGTEVGGADRFDQTLRERSSRELGYHFVIGNGSDSVDGAIEATERWKTQQPGSHAQSADPWFNERGIGICLVGNLDQYAPSKAQARSLDLLVKHLCKQYAIPAGRIYTHAEICGKGRCPGKQFDIEKLRAAVK